jgi:hypothetical protein
MFPRWNKKKQIKEEKRNVTRTALLGFEMLTFKDLPPGIMPKGNSNHQGLPNNVMPVAVPILKYFERG